MHSSKEAIIYSLTTVLDKYEPRYVGQTRYLDVRTNDHILACTRNDPYKRHRRLYNWIRSRKNNGWEILIQILKRNAIWNEDEIFFIQNFRERGFDLLNLTIGGDGGDCFSGKKHSAETKLKLSANRIGIKFTEEHIEKLRLAQQKRFQKQEERMKSGIDPKVTSEQAKIIYDNWINGKLIQDLCKEFGVSHSTLHKALIKKFGLNWREAVPDWRSRSIRERWRRSGARCCIPASLAPLSASSS